MKCKFSFKETENQSQFEFPLKWPKIEIMIPRHCAQNTFEKFKEKVVAENFEMSLLGDCKQNLLKMAKEMKRKQVFNDTAGSNFGDLTK